MGTLRLRWFAKEDLLRTITPRLLRGFLFKFQDYLKSRAIIIPEEVALDEATYQSLGDLFMNPDGHTPGELIDAAYYVSEMATPEGMDSLLDALAQVDLGIMLGDDSSPIDVAIHVWMLNPSLLQEKHAEQYLVRPRSFQSFRARTRVIPAMEVPTIEACRTLASALDVWYVNHKRGSGSRVFAIDRENQVWFLIRHGGPYRREGSLNEGKPASVAFRPLKFDVAVYHKLRGEMRVHAETEGEKTLYREMIGQHCFGDKDLFGDGNRYTLEPLMTGPASLVCTDIAGVDGVRLKELHVYQGGTQGEHTVHKAKDLFAAFDARGESLPCRGVHKAVFEFKFMDCKKPRTVAIKLPGIAQYTRDHDSSLVEEFLVKRGYVRGAGEAVHDDTDEVLAGG